MLSINCPHCNAAMTCDESAAGQYVQCYACSQKFVVNSSMSTGGAAIPPPPQKTSSPGPDVIKYISLAISIVALIAVIALFIIDFFRSPYADQEISFSKNPERTALRIFERDIYGRATSRNQRGYFWQEYAGSTIRNAEVEILQDGDDDDYVVALVSAKADKYDICEVYLLKRNKDGYFVICNEDEFVKRVDDEWLIKNRKKINNHKDDDESHEID